MTRLHMQTMSNFGQGYPRMRFVARFNSSASR
jgi:hypothetical protein